MKNVLKITSLLLTVSMVMSVNTRADTIKSGDVTPANIDTVPVIGNSDSIQVGNTAIGTLEVNNQALGNGNTLIQAGRLSIGEQVSGHGSVTVDGAGASILLPGTPITSGGFGNNRLEVGQRGFGELFILNGGLVDATVNPSDCIGHPCNQVIANGGGAEGHVTVDGSGSQLLTTSLTVSGGFVDGSFGIPGADTLGTLSITNGGNLTTGFLGFAASELADANVLVDGSGSSIIADTLALSSEGEAILNISNNGAVNTNSIQIAQSNNAYGEMNISSSGTVNTGFMDLSTDVNTVGKVSVSGSGSSLNADDLAIGQQGQADVDVTDGGTVNVVNSINVANKGNATLDVNTGGQVNSGGLFVGNGTTSNGQVNIDGAGSSVDINTFTVIGNTSTGQMDVSNEGTLNTDVLAVAGSGHGELNINSGGTVNVTGTDEGEGAVIGLFPGSSGVVTVDGSSSSLNVTKELAIGGLVGLLPGGNGTLTLKNGGTVSSDIINVNASGSINGNGTIQGNLFNLGGTIGPGLSPGVLNVDGNFDFIDGLVEIEIAGTSLMLFDQLDISGMANLAGGEVKFNFINSFLPNVGDMFEFLTADLGVSGSENLLYSIMGLGSGLDYVVNDLGTSLVLEITQAATVPEPSAWLLLSIGLIFLGFRKSNN